MSNNDTSEMFEQNIMVPIQRSITNHSQYPCFFWRNEWFTNFMPLQPSILNQFSVTQHHQLCCICIILCQQSNGYIDWQQVFSQLCEPGMLDKNLIVMLDENDRESIKSLQWWTPEVSQSLELYLQSATNNNTQHILNPANQRIWNLLNRSKITLPENDISQHQQQKSDNTIKIQEEPQKMLRGSALDTSTDTCLLDDFLNNPLWPTTPLGTISETLQTVVFQTGEMGMTLVSDPNRVKRTQNHSYGLVVGEIVRNGPADKKKIVKGSRVVGVGDLDVSKMDEVMVRTLIKTTHECLKLTLSTVIAINNNDRENIVKLEKSPRRISGTRKTFCLIPTKYKFVDRSVNNLHKFYKPRNVQQLEIIQPIYFIQIDTGTTSDSLKVYELQRLLMKDYLMSRIQYTEEIIKDTTMNDTTANDTTANDTVMDDTAVDDTAVDDTAVDDTASVGTETGGTAIDDTMTMDIEEEDGMKETTEYETKQKMNQANTIVLSSFDIDQYRNDTTWANEAVGNECYICYEVMEPGDCIISPACECKSPVHGHCLEKLSTSYGRSNFKMNSAATVPMYTTICGKCRTSFLGKIFSYQYGRAWHVYWWLHRDGDGQPRVQASLSKEQMEDLLTVIFSLEQVVKSIWLGWRCKKGLHGHSEGFNPFLAGIFSMLGSCWCLIRNQTRSETKYIQMTELKAQETAVQYFALSYQEAGTSAHLGLAGMSLVYPKLFRSVKNCPVNLTSTAVRSLYPTVFKYLLRQIGATKSITTYKHINNIAQNENVPNLDSENLDVQREDDIHLGAQEYVVHMLRLVKERDTDLHKYAIDVLFLWLVQQDRLSCLVREHSFVLFTTDLLTILVENIQYYDKLTTILVLYKMTQYLSVVSKYVLPPIQRSLATFKNEFTIKFMSSLRDCFVKSEHRQEDSTTSNFRNLGDFGITDETRKNCKKKIEELFSEYDVKLTM